MIRLVAVVTLSLLWLPAAAQTERPRNPFDQDILVETFGYGPGTPALVEFEKLYQGCPARDCIPSIDAPVFVELAQAGFLADDELVLAIDLDGDKRAYPVRILDQHEIVNDTIADQPVAVTWCPLCGSGVAFRRLLDGRVVEFGVSGLLHDSDLVMYDRDDNSLWQQITGQAIIGPRLGQVLETLPITITEWSVWRQAHPDTRVLAPQSAPGRDYGRQRHYAEYEQSERLPFPPSRRDLSVHPKTVVFGFELPTGSLAVEQSSLGGDAPLTTEVGGHSYQIVQQPDGAVVAVDEEGRSTPSIRLFWFAWFNFHPDTQRI